MSIYRAEEGSGLTGRITVDRDEAGFVQASADLLFSDGTVLRSELILDEAFGSVPAEDGGAPEGDFPVVFLYAADLSAQEEDAEAAGADEAGEDAEEDENFIAAAGAPALWVTELTEEVLRVRRTEALFLEEYRPADADLTVYSLRAEA